MKKVAVLTSSRADYGIYRPLLQDLEASKDFALQIIAFGTHLSSFHGHTIDRIREDGFENILCVESMSLGDSEEAVATAMATTSMKFASVWAQLKSQIDLIICLGDRYEMFAAVSSSVPFNIPVAHIHGGETTLGAIDNKFRHCLTHLADYHFTSTEIYRQKVVEMIGSEERVYNVGALSLSDITLLRLYDKKEFFNKFQIDLNIPTILVTFHPETIAVEANSQYAKAIAAALKKLSLEFQVLITMPNADTQGNVIRRVFLQLAQENDSIFTVESLGKKGYFSCMSHCAFLIGNTSSGIIEAASFGKYVINLGSRQKGRARSGNLLDSPIETSVIIDLAKQVKLKESYQGQNIYYQEEVSTRIMQILKTLNV